MLWELDNEGEFLARGLVCSNFWTVKFFYIQVTFNDDTVIYLGAESKLYWVKAYKLPYVTRSVSLKFCPCISWHLPSHCPAPVAVYMETWWFCSFSWRPCFSGQQLPIQFSASLSPSIGTTVWNLPARLIYFPSLVRLSFGLKVSHPYLHPPVQIALLHCLVLPSSLLLLLLPVRY